jgi:glycosyltransferase involved in cell wall biosynthesis
MPVRNGEKYIAEAIESCLQQTYSNTELLVVDDGSSDQTIDIVRGFGIEPIINQGRPGANAARNLGLKSARGVFVKFLDADDMLMPRALEQQVKFAKSLGSKQIGFGSRLDFGTVSSDGFSTSGGSSEAIPFSFYIQTSVPLHRREDLLHVGGFDLRCRVLQDWNLHVRLWEAGFSFVASDIPVILYRHHRSPERISNQYLAYRAPITDAFETKLLTWRNFSEEQKTPEMRRWFLDQLFIGYYQAKADRNLSLFNEISAELIAGGAKLEGERYSVSSRLLISLIGYETFLKLNAKMIALMARVSDASNLVPARKLQDPASRDANLI